MEKGITKNKGQITTTAALTIAVGIIGSMASAIYASAINTDSRIEARTEESRTANLEIVQRVSKLEEAVETIKNVNTDTQNQIRDFLKELRKK